MDIVKPVESSFGSETSRAKFEMVETALKAERDRCVAADEGWIWVADR